MSTPLVSIITRTFNRGHILPRAVRSVLLQTFTNFELILIDDASSDDTPAVISALKAEDKRIRAIHRQTNSRLVKPREESMNDGLRCARGRFIAYLDDDNQWRKRYLEVMVRALVENPGKVLAYCDMCDHTSEADIARRKHLEERAMVFPTSISFVAPHLGDFEQIEISPLGWYRDYVDTNEMVHSREVLDRLGRKWLPHPLAPVINASQGPGSDHRTHADIYLVERVVRAFGSNRLQYIPEILADYAHRSSPYFHNSEINLCHLVL